MTTNLSWSTAVTGGSVVHGRLPGIATILGLVAALAGPPLFVIGGDLLLGASPSLAGEILLHAFYCAAAAATIWAVLRGERLTAGSIGLRKPDGRTLAWACVVFLATVYVLPLITTPLVEALGIAGRQTGIERLSRLPTWFRIIVGVTGGAVEETLYRGYAIERLSNITGRSWLGAALAAVAFGAAHVPTWGIIYASVAAFPFGVVMTLFYVWKRNLVANALVHGGGLVVGLLTTVP